jgi:hypothetical protein
MNIEIPSKLYRKFQTFEECDGLSEIEIKEFFEEITAELLEDYVNQRLNKQQENPTEDSDDE